MDGHECQLPAALGAQAMDTSAGTWGGTERSLGAFGDFSSRRYVLASRRDVGPQPRLAFSSRCRRAPHAGAEPQVVAVETLEQRPEQAGDSRITLSSIRGHPNRAWSSGALGPEHEHRPAERVERSSRSCCCTTAWSAPVAPDRIRWRV